MTRLSLNPILPKHIPSSKDYLKVMQASALKTMKAAKRDYESTTRTWNHKPKFELVEQETSGDYLVATGTDDQRYGWIDDGTGIYGPQKQPIRPKRSKYLRFRVGGRLKTRTGVIGSSPGTEHTQWVTVTEVKGIPSRKFTPTIQKRRQKTLEQGVSHEIAKIARTQQ